MRVEPILYALICATTILLVAMVWYSSEFDGLSDIQFSKPPVTISITYYMSSQCSYCFAESAMLENLTDRYPNRFIVTKFDVDTNQSYWEDVKYYAKVYNTSMVAVPFIIIGDRAFVGYTNENNVHIENIIAGRE